MEHIAATEDTGILGIQAEHQSNAEHIQAAQIPNFFFLALRFVILFDQRIIELSYQFTGFNGDFLLSLDPLTAGVDQEAHAFILCFQFAQQNHFWRIVGPVHIMDMEFTKITSNNPPGFSVERQFIRIPFGLLERCQHGSVRLLGTFEQINAQALLLNQNAGVFHERINKTGMAQLHGNFKFNDIFGF